MELNKHKNSILFVVFHKQMQIKMCSNISFVISQHSTKPHFIQNIFN